MKLLLVNTPINRQDVLGKFSSIYDDLKMVPTGLAGLASFLRGAGIDVRILDQYAECLPMERILTLIEGYAPDLIGYSATTPNYYASIDLVRQVRARYPALPTVMGGMHPSILPAEVLRDPAVDYVIRDEGELSLLALCTELQEKRRHLEKIDGLSFKTASGQVHNHRSSPVALDELPLPAYDLLPMHLYSSPSYTKFAKPVYQMIASRGCPYGCTYCVNAESNVAARYRRRSMEKVADEMELLVRTYGARQIQFWDPIFPLGKKHALDFCQILKERGLHKSIVWNSTTRPDFLTDEVAEAMVDAGCRGIGFGIESGVPELLRSVNKKLDLEKVRESCRIARKHGLVVVSGFILGFPGETKEMSQQTIDFAKSLDLHYAQFSVMVPYPGTPLYRELEAAGEILPVEENDFVRYNQSAGLTGMDPIYVPKGRTAAELRDLQRRAYSEFYLRPKMVSMHLPHVRWATLVGMLRSLAVVVGVSLSKLGERLRGGAGDHVKHSPMQ